MNTSIKNLSQLEREIVIEIKNSEIESEKNKQIDLLSSSLTIRGFRKGHVTKNIILSKFEKKIDKDVINDLVNKQFTQIIKENKINIANSPIFRISKNENETIVYIKFEIFPEIKLNFENITIYDYIVDIKDSDILKEKNKLNVIYGNWLESDSTVLMNDLVVLDVYETSNSNILLKDLNVFLHGREKFFEGFFSSIINLKKNDYFTINLFNKKVFDDNLLNKKEIKIYIKSIKRSVWASDYELSKKINHANIDNFDLYSYVKNKLIESSNFLIKEQIKFQIINLLLKKNYFDLPKSLIEKIIFDYNTKKIIFSIDKVKNDLKIKFIFNEIKHKFNLNVSKNEIDLVLKNLSKDIKNNSERYLLSKKIENDILEEKIMELILDKINIIKEKIDFEKLVNMEYENADKS